MEQTISIEKILKELYHISGFRISVYDTYFQEIAAFPKELGCLCSLIQENPDYGEVICRCEKVTRAEILAAIHNPLGVDTMAGIKYRTRSMMGRCQGGYCQMRIAQMIEEELGKKETEVQYAGKGSQMFFGKVRQEV